MKKIFLITLLFFSSCGYNAVYLNNDLKNFKFSNIVFEGDEELLWSYKDYGTMQLEPLSLGRLANDNWFEKGSSSAQISLSAFSKLQRVSG